MVSFPCVTLVFLLLSVVESFHLLSSDAIASLRFNKLHIQQHLPTTNNDKTSLIVNALPPLLVETEESSVFGNRNTSASFQSDSDSDSDSDRSIITFTSSPVPVYIEDTDAYGIIYNSNYLRMFDRVLFTEMLSGHNSKELQSVLGNDWSVVAVGHQKFVSSPILGSEVIIHGQLSQIMKTSFDATKDNHQSRWSVWNMEMRSIDGTKIYNIVKDLVIASTPLVEDINQLKDILPKGAIVVDNDNDDGDDKGGTDSEEEEESTATTKVSFHDTFRIQRDELDAHATEQLPLRTILSYFERGRTNMFGGPNNLQKMQQENGILAVVTSIRDLSPVGRYYSNIDNQCRFMSVKAGDEIDVTSMVQVKRKVRYRSWTTHPGTLPRWFVCGVDFFWTAFIIL
jgi:acyl-CoA thioesterase FadM